MKLKLDANFGDLLRFFAALKVKYLVVGGWAVSVHAQPRATMDMDILVSSEPSNLEAVYSALLRFGAPLETIDKRTFLEAGTFFRLGIPPCQIDIFTAIDGVTFEECWTNRFELQLEPEGVAQFISVGDLIKNKLASGRPQDLADAEAIERAQVQRRKW